MKRRNNKRGFTLAELLIVVAIIAVLVAVAIPVFSGQLEKSREQTDIANLRAVKAAAIVAAMDQKVDLDGVITPIDYGTGDTASYYFDANKGTFVKTTDTAKPAVYGKGTVKSGGCDDFILGTTSPSFTYQDTTDAQNKVIQCTFTKAKAAVVGGESEKEATYQLSWEAISTD